MSKEKGIAHDVMKQSLKGPVKQSVGAVFDTINRAVEALDLFGTYGKTQKGHIKTSHVNIKLLGMTSPIPLARIYYPTRVSTTIRRRLYEQEWLSENAKISSVPKMEQRRKNPTVVDAAEYVRTNSKVVVLGGPGAGKTTFLRFLALMHADCIDNAPAHMDLLPFFVHLPHFAKTRSGLFEFAIDTLLKATDQHAEDFATRLFGAGSALLLLDSFDEIPRAQRSNVITRIKAFETLYPNVRIVISCRTADYEESLPNFCEVEVSRLSHEAIAKIIRAWFDGETSKATELINLIKNDGGVEGLTETPLLLSLLCIQYRHDLQLPKRKTELYKRCLYALLRDWDSERGFSRDTSYESMSDDRKERLFEHIAGKFFIEQESYEFRKEQVLDVVGEFVTRLDIPESEAARIIDEIERHHGILEQVSQDYFSFSHTSMQDYFVARHLLSKRTELELLSENIENENWYPIVEFVLALAEDPTLILNLLIRKSDMKGLSNFPPMARRTKLLMLLHRGMLSAPFVTRELSKQCYEHLVKSQIQMAGIFESGKVIPFPELGSFGVRHVLFYMDRPRPTLGDALGPYRKFSNQILTSPLNGYATACLTAADALQLSTEQVVNHSPLDSLANDATILNLIMPLGTGWPEEVASRLHNIEKRNNIGFVKNIIQRSLAFIDSQ
ncbi:MAG: NACHT domain-containing protein [Sterolibacterium sp.]